MHLVASAVSSLVDWTLWKCWKQQWICLHLSWFAMCFAVLWTWMDWIRLEKRCQFHQRSTYKFFVRTSSFWQLLSIFVCKKKAAETTFVRKIRTFNVDEIDTRWKWWTFVWNRTTIQRMSWSLWWGWIWNWRGILQYFSSYILRILLSLLICPKNANNFAQNRANLTLLKFI